MYDILKGENAVLKPQNRKRKCGFESRKEKQNAVLNAVFNLNAKCGFENRKKIDLVHALPITLVPIRSS